MRSHLVRTLVLVLFMISLVPPLAAAHTFEQGSSLPGISNEPSAAAPASPGVVTAPRMGHRAIAAPSQAAQPGESCTYVDFEGVGNQSPIPEFDGISSPNWLGIIDQDAGGTGNIAFEPSPSTVAFWLGGATGTGSSRDIVFADPVALVRFFYTSAVTTQITAFDADGNIVTTAIGAANLNAGPGGDPTGAYNRWDPLQVDATANEIARIRVFGAINQTAIDNLEVCRSLKINAVEFTQAIQQFQELDDLKADLRADGKPPVPLVAGKPAVLRVYMDEVDTTTPVQIEISGVITRRREVLVQPGCTPEESRRQDNGCRSIDFYFTPPAGSWSVTIRVADQYGAAIESHDLSLTSVTTNPLRLSAVRICDAQDANNNWLCDDTYYQRLQQLAPLLRKIAPTNAVTIDDSGETVRRAIDANSDSTVTAAEGETWWTRTRQDVARLYSFADWLRDLFGVEERRYYGIVRQGINDPSGILGIASGIPGTAAMSLAVAQDRGQDVSQDTVAHEVFHTLNRKHTNSAVPTSSCSLARDPATDWPYSDNGIQEVGFDVALRRAISPTDGGGNSTMFDIMSYCVPVWISPHTYTRLLTEQAGLASAEVQQTAEGDFWQVSGVISGTTVLFDDLYMLPTRGPIGVGTGTYSIEVRSTTGTTLFVRRFTPSASEARVSGQREVEGPPYFSELIPVQSGAATIVVLDSANTTIGSLTLQGAAPQVTLVFPVGGEQLSGVQTLRWSVTDSDSTDHSYWVQYSPDGGADQRWRSIASGIESNQLVVNFDQLPGGDTARVRVIASDGVNSGNAASNTFTVPMKPPVAEVIEPGDDSAYQPGDLVWLQGYGFDIDSDGLDESAIRWVSNIDGDLGTGADLPVTSLSSGVHIITLVVESDGAQASDTVRVVIDGIAPKLSVIAQANGIPTSCVVVRASATDVGGSGVQSLEYSLNGGDTWANVPRSDFVVDQTGFIHLVVRATDRAGNINVEDRRFFVESICRDPGTITAPIFLPMIIR